ncbi:MAG TPA: gamma-glutamyltransferase family protein [Thermoplasmata archaeon]|nr:gamma-glutamyltransferase family protein [Thermoplasmata archaeon]
MSHAPLPFASRRSPVYARHGMVASSQPLATEAGIEILRDGGNAADAAVATAALLALTEPTSTGLGGDCFALFYDGGSGKVTALNGSGRAPHGLTLDLLKEQGFGRRLPPFHAHNVTVPGACAGWCDLVDRHGTLGMDRILARAIRAAEEGFPVAPLTAYSWAGGAARQLRSAAGGRQLLLDGRAPKAGEVFRNPGLARTFRAIARDGKEAFYRGEIAGRIATAVQASGGVLTVEDLAAHYSTWDEPVSTAYGGVRLWECPPNGQGLVALLTLNLLSEFDLPRDPLGTGRLHLLIEALRLAFADAHRYIADPTKAEVPTDALLREGYAAERAHGIGRGKANLRATPGLPSAGSDTVYFSVADGSGNACSFINSNYMGFGTGIVPEGTGFPLQNRGANFFLDPGHPNALAPGKRPYHTIIPAMATREGDGSLYACYGVMGGFMQPQGHVQVLLALLDGLDPQAALDRPRICLDEGEPGGTVLIEEGIPETTAAGLRGRGHRIRRIGGMERAVFGRGQVILRNPTTGVLCGGSDPRADGCAMGF